MAYENHWLPGFNFNVEEWDASGQTYETLAICRTLALARAAFAAAIADKPTGRFMIRSRTRVVTRHPAARADRCAVSAIAGRTASARAAVARCLAAAMRW
jgi:hypothetical protein